MKTKLESYQMKPEEVPECWLKPKQLQVLDVLCRAYNRTLKDVMIEQTLDWARRRTDGYSDLSEDLRKKLGKEWDF